MIDERDSFENGYYYFVQALEILAADPESQCERMGNYNVAWELRHGVTAGAWLLRMQSTERLSSDQRNGIRNIVGAVSQVPVDELPAGGDAAANLEAMNHPSWISIREMASALVEILKPATEECRRFLNCGPDD